MSVLTTFSGLITGPVVKAVESAAEQVAVPAILDAIGSQAAAGTISTDVSKIVTDVTKALADAKAGKFAWGDIATTAEDLLNGLVALEAKPAPVPLASVV